MKPIYFLPFLSLLLLAPASGNAAGSMLRIACEGDNVGAEISINGTFKGECPLDIQVNDGVIKVRAYKKAGEGHERIFEQEFRLGAGVVKKVEVNLGNPQLTAGQKLEYEREIEKVRKLVEAGDTSRIMQLGAMYSISGNHGAANQWYRKAAAAGDSDAMMALASAYALGDGVPVSDAEAVQWYRKAADAGNVKAMYELANSYRDGTGVQKSFEQSFAWIRKAADAGHIVAMFGLALRYERGLGVAKSEEEAIRWYRAAASKGNANAIDALKKRGLR